MALKPTATRFDKIVSNDQKIPSSFNGKTYIGLPRLENVPEDLKYLDPLTNYEMMAFSTRHDHVLCPRCYDKSYNRARFGLCAPCYNTESHKTLQVVDAKIGKVYLTRRGGKIRLTGPMVRLPIMDGRSVVGYKTILERPYVDMSRVNTTAADYAISMGDGKWHKLYCHATLPMEYLLAELD